MKNLSFILPILSGVFFGSGGVFVRILMEHGLGNFAIIETRVLAASVFLALFLLLYDKRLFHVKKKDIWLFPCGGLGAMFGLTITYNESIKYLSLGFSAVLLSLFPLFVLVLAAILFHEKITIRKTCCAVLCLFGCGLASGAVEQGLGSMSVRGIIMGLLSAIFYAIYSLVGRAATDRGYSGLTVTLYSMVSIAIVLLIPCPWGEVTELLSAGPVKWMIFLILHALFVSALPYALLTVAIGQMGAGKASILASCEPVAAMIFGALFFSEQPTIVNLIGLLVTIGALILLNMPERNRQSV